MKKYILILAVIGVFAAPSFSYAQTTVSTVETQAQYVALLKQIIVLLQQQVELLIESQKAATITNTTADTNDSQTTDSHSQATTTGSVSVEPSIQAYGEGVAQRVNDTTGRFTLTLSIVSTGTDGVIDPSSLIGSVYSGSNVVGSISNVQVSGNSVCTKTFVPVNATCKYQITGDYTASRSGYYYAKLSSVGYGLGSVTLHNLSNVETGQVYLGAN